MNCLLIFTNCHSSYSAVISSAIPEMPAMQFLLRKIGSVLSIFDVLEPVYTQCIKLSMTIDAELVEIVMLDSQCRPFFDQTQHFDNFINKICGTVPIVVNLAISTDRYDVIVAFSFILWDSLHASYKRLPGCYLRLASEY